MPLLVLPLTCNRLCLINVYIADTVEGAHSDEQKSHRSDSHSDEGSDKRGSRGLPPLLGDFDVLRFKNRFLEVCTTTITVLFFICICLIHR